jgi:hypothetical protein
MNLMMTLSLLSALAIGRIPAYLLAKAKQTDRKGQGEIHNFKTLISIPAWKSKPSWVAVATKDRTINPDLERGMPRAHMATRSKSWGQPLGLHLETQGGCSSHRRRCNARAMKSSEVLCARCKQFYM